MKLSDYIIQFLNDKYNVDTIFTVSGGGCIHLLDSLGKNENINYIATHHEQGAAIAAEGYARHKNNLGACLVTSGPGGTNCLTGTLCSYLDSVPVIVISGQVNKKMTTNYLGLKMRQLGDQEFDIVKTAQTMTKYAIQVNDPNEIRYIRIKVFGGEGGPASTLAPKLGPLGLNAKKIGEDIIKESSKMKGIR